MKITYTFVTGEIVEVEVSEDLGAEIIAIEHQADLRDRAETRRHESIDAMKESAGFEPVDLEFSVDGFIDQLSCHDAIAYLPENQQYLIRKVYFDGKSVSEIARAEGVTEGAVRKRLKKAQEALKKYFD